jgi:hypothetical protein
MVPVGDLQVGKPDGGGTAGTIERFARLTEAVAQRILASPGGRVEALVLPWLGDCIEGLVSQNGRLPLDISVTEAVRVVRRLMLHQLAVLAPLADRILVPVLAGNHDEVSRLRKMPETDSWAIDAASAVQDALELSGKYGHVTFLYPDPGELTVSVDIGGQVLAFTHGHVASSPDRIPDWWKGQAIGRQPAGEADLLVTAHFHHFRAQAIGGNRTWIQIPALDGGSDWFRNKKGEDVPGGMVSMWLTPGIGPGYEGLTIHN